jgi:maleylpyruvate isomerase
MTPILHGYWRSGTSYRTRIALNLKGVDYETAPVNLIEGAQKSEAYLALNPQGLVPALEVDGAVLTQSPAILEWLEETYPEPQLLPDDALGRAAVRAMSAVVGCDIHPLNNLRILKTLRKAFEADPAQIDEWAQRWIAEGFAALEQLIERHGGRFAYGDRPTLADCYLVPQVYSARRFNLDLEPYPRLRAACAEAEALPEVATAHPDRQPGASPG